jgi:hypothetical protein
MPQFDYETFAEAAKDRLSNHVYVCVSQLMHELINKAEHFSPWEDDLWSASTVESEEDDEDDCEVYEHWIVSNDAKRELESVGEKVVEIFDLNIWCRTTTGQSVWYDFCMQELGKRYLNQ